MAAPAADMQAYTIDGDDDPVAPPSPAAAAPAPLQAQQAGSAGGAEAAAAAAASAAAADAADAPAAPAPEGTATIAAALQSIRSNSTLITAAEARLQELLAKQESLILAERVLEQDAVAALLADRAPPPHNGRPVAALALVRCLLQWGALAPGGGGGGGGAALEDDPAALLRRYSDLVTHHVRAAAADDDDDDGSGGGGFPAVGSGAGGDAAAYWLAQSSVLLALSVRRSIALLQRRLAEGMRELQLGHRLGDGLTTLFARRPGSRVGASDGGEGSSGGAAAAAASAEPSGEAGGMHEPAPSLASISSDATSLGPAGSAPPAAPPPAGPGRGSPAPASGRLSGLLRRAHSGGAAAPPAAAPAPAGPDPLDEFVGALDAAMQRAYYAFRDQLRRRLLPLLANCMQQVGGGTASTTASMGGSMSEGDAATAAAVAAAAAAGARPSAGGAPFLASADSMLEAYRDWSELGAALAAAVGALRAAGVPEPLTRELMRQTMDFVNAQLFNQLLLRPELCRAGNARYALRGLRQLDSLLLAEGEGGAEGGGEIEAAAEARGEGGAGGGGKRGADPVLGEQAWAALSHTRQALQFLALERKGELTIEDITSELCPALSRQQLYRLCTTAWDDKPGAESCRVSGEVLEAMHARHLAEAAAAAPFAAVKLAGFTLGLAAPAAALTNQGLVVTCLLDEPGPPRFVAAAGGSGSGGSSASGGAGGGGSGSGAGGGGRVGAESAAAWLEGRDYSEGLPVPGVLLEGCPPDVFGFLSEPTQGL
ncbi:MAG: hypothetical protein J3K34DRAFT_520030 [Monoraphidium minutum]|nr:MAG: hypothetical protein J3K34DRAFT_520030 [Monoraphidium minutum]